MRTQSQSVEQGLIRQILFKYLPYWPLFILCLLIAICGAWIYLRYTSPKFEATATLIIKDQKKGTNESKILEQLDLLTTKKIIENELEVLQSRTLMEEVVRDLHIYAPVFSEGKVNTTSAYTSSPIFVEANIDSIKETKKVVFKFEDLTQTVVIDKIAFPMNQWVDTKFGKLRFGKNQKYLPPLEQKIFYFSLLSPKLVSLNLLENLSVSAASKLSSIINLSYKDEVPQRAEDILNALIDHYEQAAINEKANLAKNTLAFVEDRLSLVSNDLDSIERKLQQFKSTKGAIDISTQGGLFLRNVSENDQKLSEVNMKLAVLNQIESFAHSQDNSAAIVPSTLGVNDAVLTNLLDKLYTSEMEYERLRKTVAENNPMLSSLRNQISKLRPDILENIQSQRSNLLASRSNINATNNSYNSMLSTMPAKERQLIDISRDQTIKNNIYSFLLQKREESALSSSASVPDSRIVDKAQASLQPVSPRRKLVYIAAILIAFVFSIASIGGREMMNGKILYRQDLELLTHTPIIGEIAFYKAKTRVVIEKRERSFVAEEFRKIRMSLPFLGIGEKGNTILITSSIPGEGKSFISANLAASLSFIDKTVVLIDLDLNNPTMKNIEGFEENQAGVSQYLSGEKQLDEIINNVKGNDYFFYINSGILPESPAELLSNGMIKKLIDDLRVKFGYVIIDTSPVVPVTDAYIISPYCDATLFVVRHKHTPKVFIKRLDENFKINPLTNPAIIFNGVKPRGFFKQRYGYGYGYGYVYNSLQEKNKKPGLLKRV